MKKELYEEAELNIARFDSEDVIVTSGGDGFGEPGAAGDLVEGPTYEF